MKSSFSGYFRLDKGKINELWQTCTFAVDTNILLNLYRYSDKTREELLKILYSLQDRLWIPYQAAHEYLKDRLNVIGQQEKAYSEMLKVLGDILSRFEDSRQHPFVSQNLLTELSSMMGKVKDELGQNRRQYADRISSDDVLDRIGLLLDGKVGPDMSPEDKTKLIAEAKERYLRKIPPGYRDSGKDKGNSDFEDIRKFGDFFIWKQIIDKARESNTGIIFVTDDRKDDWWLISNGRTVGPLPDLLQEFKNESGQPFYMYQPDRFMEFAVEYLQQQVGGDAIKEVREFREKKEEQLNQEVRSAVEKMDRRRAELESQDSSELEEARRQLAKARSNAFLEELEKRRLVLLKRQAEYLSAKSELDSLNIVRNKLLHDAQGKVTGQESEELGYLTKTAEHRVESLHEAMLNARNILNRTEQELADSEKEL